MLKVDIRIEYAALKIESSFHVPTGKGAALMGPSGSGKSSILSVIAGFYRPALSEVYFNNQRLDSLSPAERPLTILFQEHNLFAHLDIWKNIAIGLNPKLKISPAQHQQISHALRRVGLEGFDKRLPATLSGGQKQRVALARCLVRDKPLLLLDEPFNGLDQARHIEIRQLIHELVQEKHITLLLATHHHEDAELLCDQVIEVEAKEKIGG